VDNSTPSVTAGKIFNSAFVSAPTLVPATTGGTLPVGTYSYEVTAVLASGVEVPGAISAPLSVTAGVTNKVTVSWSSYPGAASYNVYGNNANSVRLLKNVPAATTSYVDTGPTSLIDNPFTLPSTGTFPVNVASTAGFNSGANTIQFGASGPVTCTGTTSTSFTVCSGGQPGQYATGTPVYSASTGRPPLSTLTVTLPIDQTPADAKQRSVLSDDIALRNSR
jgi:hypothetical protein